MKRNQILPLLLSASLLFGGCAVQKEQAKSGQTDQGETQEINTQTIPQTNQETPTDTTAKENSTQAKTTENNGEAKASSALLTESDAKALALAKVAGATESDIRKFKTEYENGRTEYEGEILYNGTEYDFEIDAETGAFLSWEEEATGNVSSASSFTADDAKAAALARVAGAAAGDLRKFETDYDDGRTVYEGEILYNGVEYDFEINAADGSFISWEEEIAD